jgi:hypothetical protein
LRRGGGGSGLFSTSQQLCGAIGVAIASSIAASRFHTLVGHGSGTSAALTGGFQSTVADISAAPSNT